MKIVNGWIEREDYEPEVSVVRTENYWEDTFAKKRPIACIIHYSAAGHVAETISFFKRGKASAHVLIGRDGSIFQMISFRNAAWHAGKSQIVIDGKKYKGLNKWMLGIELANWGLLKRVEKKDEPAKFYCWPPLSIDGKALYQKEFFGEYIHAEGNWWEKFPEKQIASLVLVCKAMMIEYSWDERRFVGHCDVAPGRKIDPGAAFDWADFRRRLVGDWEMKDINLKIKELEIKQGDRRDC